jgi:DNA (cytosine-5)-methyltransferase 1
MVDIVYRIFLNLTMKMLDLFSGIGGFSLAAEWVWSEDLEVVGFCEIEPFAVKVLNKNFPGVPIYNDVCKLDGRELTNKHGNIDIITGGFPCQDISIAGRGVGIDGKRSGLWSEMCRIISEVRPRYAFIENVPMLIHRGLERVLTDLTKIGYDAEWQVIGADDVGAWHRRKRIWIVAYPQGNGSCRDPKQREEDGTYEEREFLECEGERRDEVRSLSERGSKDVSDPECNGWNGREYTEREYTIDGKGQQIEETEQFGEGFRSKPGKGSSLNGKDADPLCEGLQGQRECEQLERKSPKGKPSEEDYTSDGEWWAAEPNVGRVAHGIPHRVDRLKGLGNAIVPQVAKIVFERIKLLDDLRVP